MRMMRTANMLKRIPYVRPPVQLLPVRPERQYRLSPREHLIFYLLKRGR